MLRGSCRRSPRRWPLWISRHGDEGQGLVGADRDPVVDAQEEEGLPQPAIVEADQDGETPFTVE